MMNRIKSFRSTLLLIGIVCVILTACEKPHERIVLRDIRDVVVDASTEPLLKANAIFFNPNDMHGRLRKIDVVIYVDGKRAAHVDQRLRTVIPANGEFKVPLEVKLSIKELGFMDTLLGVLGGKKFEVRYEGKLKMTYKGIPFSVPVNYKDEVRVRF
ncbi:MAG TPA: LEA type 2 family protein [Chryseolinea sp.]|nr:LEA type 2 family protein [Chryseolinea sp.]